MAFQGLSSRRDPMIEHSKLRIRTVACQISARLHREIADCTFLRAPRYLK